METSRAAGLSAVMVSSKVVVSTTALHSCPVAVSTVAITVHSASPSRFASNRTAVTGEVVRSGVVAFTVSVPCGAPLSGFVVSAGLTVIAKTSGTTGQIPASNIICAETGSGSARPSALTATARTITLLPAPTSASKSATFQLTSSVSPAATPARSTSLMFCHAPLASMYCTITDAGCTVRLPMATVSMTFAVVLA